MKLVNLLFASALLIGFNSQAQDDTERECTRMRFLAGEELKINNYAGAATYYLKGEKICGGYDAANYARMIGSLRNAMNANQDKAAKTAYADTLEGAYTRAEAAGAYDVQDDLFRASNILQSSAPDRVKADMLFRRGIDASGAETNQAYVSYFYYNTYAMWSEEKDAAKKADIKKRLIGEFFELSTLISEANMSVKTQETITTYFNYVVKNCDDILPDLKGYIENLPTDVEVRKVAVKNFIGLLEKKECTTSAEYETLVIEFDKIDGSIDSKIALGSLKEAKNQYGAAIEAYKNAKTLTDDSEKIQEISYRIASAQYKSGQYTAAYNTAMSVSGQYKGKALTIAGNSVGKNANNCGTSTFERKCNYIYAVQLLEQARANGENTSGTISSFRNNFPTDGEVFENGSPSSVTLSCYGVSVSPK